MGENLNTTKKGLASWQADLMLIFVTMCWGVSYMLMDFCLGDMTPFALNMFRFIVGGFVIFICAPKRVIKHTNLKTIKYAIICGLSLLGTYAGATIGVQYTTISNSGFLCAMTVVFTPIFSIIFLKQKQDMKTMGAVLLSFIGIALLTLNDDFSINVANLKGDLLCLSCGFFYAINLLLVEKAVSNEEVEPYTFGTYQLLVVGICNAILAPILMEPDRYYFPQSPKVFFAALFLAVFCTGVAFVLQPIAQQYTTASRVGVIFTLEPVFNVIVAFLVLREILSIKSYIGGFLMVFAIIFMEVDFKELFRKKE